MELTILFFLGEQRQTAMGQRRIAFIIEISMLLRAARIAPCGLHWAF